MKYIEIPVTQMMEDDLKNCEKESRDRRDEDCDFCSLNGGEMYECLAGYRWTDGGGEKEDGKEKEAGTRTGAAEVP